MNEKQKYLVKILPAAQKQIKKASSEIRRKIIGLLDILENNPRPEGTRKLRNLKDHYRLSSVT